MLLVLFALTIAAANFAIGFALAVYLGHGPALDSLLPRKRGGSSVPAKPESATPHS